MAEIEVTCPSGLRGIVRGLKMREFKLFADRRGMRNGAVWDEITKSCWIETLERGPAYKADPRWATEVLQGDRLYALMAIRRATHGDVFDFSATCADRSCRATIKWSVNLNDELKVKRYPIAALREHVEGRRFTATLAGKRVEFGLMTAADEKLMAKFVEQNTKEETDRLIATIAFRCRTVAGIPNKRDVIEWLNDLELADVLAFRDQMDELSGGVDTSFEVECGECGARSEVELPFGGKEFWTPKTIASSSTGRTTHDSSSDATSSTTGEESSTSSATSDTEEADTE